MENWKILRQGVWAASVFNDPKMNYWESLKFILDPWDMPKNMEEKRRLRREFPMLSNRLRKRIFKEFN